MAEEIDDNEFYQQDFTTASEWEIFNARLEEHIHEWKLPFVEIGCPLAKNELSLCEWGTKTEMILFADVELKLTRYCAKVDNRSESPPETRSREIPQQPQAFYDLMSLNNNHCIVDERSDSNIHSLARWYGLRDFVVVSPVAKAILNESQIRIMLSSIHIAVADSSCEVPIFFQALETKQNVFAGVCENRTTRLSFDIVHLQQTPPTCKYLTGLLDMFKGKIGIQYVDPVMVSVRITYGLNRFSNAVFKSPRKYAFYNLHNDNSDADDDLLADSDTFCLLPFGVSIDPVKEIQLHCTWPQIAENVVIDSQNYSDFDPLLAPDWSLRARFEQAPICYLSECLTEYLQLVENRRTLTDLLGNGYNLFGTNDSGDVNPLDVLTESKISTILPTIPSMASVSGTNKRVTKADGPLNEEQLMKMLYYMFPDAQPESLHSYDVPEFDHVRNEDLMFIVHVLRTFFYLGFRWIH